MPRVTFVLWKWHQEGFRTVYSAEHVNVMARMLRRHCSVEPRIVCVTDNDDGVYECEVYPLWSDCSELSNPSGEMLPSCYRRLRIFDSKTTDAMGVARGEQVISVDLDVVVTGCLDELLMDDQDFCALWGAGTYQPVVYNGSIFKVRTGALDHVWRDFDPVASPRETRVHNYYGSDQAWISLKIAGRSLGWDYQHGVYVYSRVRHMPVLPPNSVLVTFNGKHKPWDEHVMQSSPWIRKNWR